jgi:hypothetical protein
MVRHCHPFHILLSTTVVAIFKAGFVCGEYAQLSHEMDLQGIQPLLLEQKLKTSFHSSRHARNEEEEGDDRGAKKWRQDNSQKLVIIIVQKYMSKRR